MQYMLIEKTDTLQSVSRIVGQQNIDAVIAENSLARTPKLGQAWYDKCEELLQNSPNPVSASRKESLLNSLVGSSEIFEKACLMDEDEWKIFSAFQAFNDAIRVPESVVIPNSVRVIGNGSNQATQPVSNVTYTNVITSLHNNQMIDASQFNSIDTKQGGAVIPRRFESGIPQAIFKIPWGKIQLYSSLLDEVVDFPAYPEQLNQTRNATYASMPDTIYQYEPWIVYENSGPRDQEVSFHLHRDMWSGNHLDGQANRLIRFCQSNTFPRYSGSAVLAPTVRLYINGSLFIAGVLKSTTVDWSGPLGQDDWYLEFNLSLSIQEVSDKALNIDTVRKTGLIG